jgi:hypothetical protein
MEELDAVQRSAEGAQHFERKGHEFPTPFNFGGPKFYEYESAHPINRAERRRVARKARKEAKEASKQMR